MCGIKILFSNNRGVFFIFLLSAPNLKIFHPKLGMCCMQKRKFCKVSSSLRLISTNQEVACFPENVEGSIVGLSLVLGQNTHLSCAPRSSNISIQGCLFITPPLPPASFCCPIVMVLFFCCVSRKSAQHITRDARPPPPNLQEFSQRHLYGSVMAGAVTIFQP